MTNFEKVGIFMKTFGQEIKTKPSLNNAKINSLRISLIKEELEELTDAMKNKDLVEVADALTEVFDEKDYKFISFSIDTAQAAIKIQN